MTSKIRETTKRLNQLAEVVKYASLKLDEANKKAPMNNMFMWYSKTTVRAFMIEKQLWFLLVLSEHIPMLKKSMASLETFKALQAKCKGKSWTMRNLFRALRERNLIPIKLFPEIEKFIDDRDYLIHHFITDNMFDVFGAPKYEDATRKLENYYLSFIPVYKELQSLIAKMQRAEI